MLQVEVHHICNEFNATIDSVGRWAIYDEELTVVPLKLDRELLLTNVKDEKKEEIEQQEPEQWPRRYSLGKGALVLPPR